MSASSVFVRGRLSPRNTDRLRALFLFLFRLFARLEIRGQERLPAGSCIVCPNHLSRFDGPLVFSVLPGRAVTAFAGDTYRARPFFRFILEMVDVIWVHRGAIGPSTIRAALQALREGRLLGVAPEGTRSPTHALQRGKTGAAALAVAAGVPIVPLAITNTDQLAAAMRRWPWGGRIDITVQIGEPFTLPAPEPGTPRAQKLDEYTDEIMCRIAALLPARYHGVYADHPRLAALRAAAAPAEA